MAGSRQVFGAQGTTSWYLRTRGSRAFAALVCQERGNAGLHVSWLYDPRLPEDRMPLLPRINSHAAYKHPKTITTNPRILPLSNLRLSIHSSYAYQVSFDSITPNKPIHNGPSMQERQTSKHAFTGFSHPEYAEFRALMPACYFLAP